MNLENRIKKLEKSAEGEADLLIICNFHKRDDTVGFKCGDKTLPRLQGEPIENLRDRAITLFKKSNKPTIIFGYKDGDI